MEGNPADRPNPHRPKINATSERSQQSSTAKASSAAQGGRPAKQGAQGIDAGDDQSTYQSIPPGELHHSPNPDELING